MEVGAMSLMPWDLNKFDVRVQAMNHDHEHIVEIINRIHDADAAGAPPATVLGCWMSWGPSPQSISRVKSN